MTRYVLGSLLAFVAANAVGGGFYGVSGAEGVPIEWLRGSPFTTYLVPSLILNDLGFRVCVSPILKSEI